MSDPRRTFSAGVAAIERWSLPVVDGPVIGRVPDERHSAAATEAIIRAARQESEARGYEAGLARAQTQMQGQISELDAQVKQLDSVLQLMGRPLHELDLEVEKMLLHLALAVGKQLARRELRIDPAQVIAIIRESLGQLPSAAREIRVHLHPEDAAIVRERLTAPANERAWTIVEDPTLSRGGCVVRTENSQIDARLESRINTVITSALGDERAQDRQSANAVPGTGSPPALGDTA
ncbi:MAG: flagellar assembly protein FliH [Gammaproteobacteria bacterium]|nr:flagellar assembly protein FliH [Gammaproteobacteria bacterium]